MLKRALRTLGKSLVILTGAGYGVVKALDILTTGAHEDRPDSVEDSLAEDGTGRGNATSSAPGTLRSDTDEIARRLDVLDARLSRLEKSIEAFVTAPGNGGRAVTRAELSAAMEQLSSCLNADIERRFEAQNRSVQSLRTMIARTDELLERVIENIESVSIGA